MAENLADDKTTTTTKPPTPASRRGPGSGMGMPVEKANNFGKTLGRLVKLIAVDKVRTFLLILLLILSAGLAALSPKVLGNATNVLFDGLVSKQVTNTIECNLPNGVTLDIVKSQIDDANGNMDFGKLQKMMQKMAGTSAGNVPQTPSAQAQNIAPISADVKDGITMTDPETGETVSGASFTLKPLDEAAPVTNTRPEHCGESSESAGEFNGSTNLDGVKDMLSSMTITLGGGVDFNKFGYALILVIIVYLLSFVLRWIAGWISVRLIANASQTLRQRIEEKIWRLPLKYFDSTSRGDVMSRTTNDLDNVTQTLNQTGGDFIYMTLMVICVVIMMFLTSWLLALIALVTIPLSGILISLIMKVSGKAFKMQWASTGKVNSIAEETFTGHLLIKAYGKRDQYKAQFEKENDTLFKSSFKAQVASGCIMPIMMFLTNINYVVVALVGALRIASGQMSLGDVQAFVQYSRQFSQPLGQISQMLNMLQSGAASAERIFEMLDASEESDEADLPQEFDVKSGQITFQGVDFSYTSDRELIKNMNLVAQPGQTVAIVGQTGAGKTTLVNLIMRFYDVDAGKIDVDGTDTMQISRQALRKNVGMVLQDTWLFKGTIRENLMYGVPDGRSIDDETFYEACRATYVDHFVRGLPDGYDTVLDNDGSAISTGEKQLLTIARAFLADPNILILDEATSSVDTRTEVLVQKAMNALRSNRTSFVIAHRLSTIRDADVIVVMEKGSIVEQGNHDTLIRKGGDYAKLYQSQFEQASVDEDGHGESLEGVM